MSRVHELHAARSPAPVAGRDRRRFRRVPLKLEGRFLDPGSEEHAFLTQDISCGGAHVVSKARPAVGASIVCYIDNLARISARVVRHTAQGFVIVFNIPVHKREKIADRLTWLLNAERLGLSEERRAERFPASGKAVILRQDGSTVTCRTIGISLTGASFEADDTPPFVGETVTAGSIRAEVVRRECKAFAVRFLPSEAQQENELLDLAKRHRERLALR